MLKRLALCLFLLSPLAACATAPAYAQVTAEIVIDDDPGGLVEQQVMWHRRLEDAGIAIRFRGLCKSACTLNLHNPNKCVEPTASFGFHRARQGEDGHPDAAYTGALARRWYPEPVVKLIYYVDKHDLWPKNGGFIFVSAKTIVAHGVAPWCDGFAPVEADEGEVEPSK